MPRSLLSSVALVLCVSMLPSGCVEEPTDSCPLKFLGDKAKQPEIELVALGGDGKSAKVSDGDAVGMIFPPQGGRVIFAGVRATNVDPCAVKLTGALRDPVTKQVRVDKRTINLKPFGDGWGGSDDDDISSFANVPVCPNQWAQADLFGSDYELSIELRDRHDHAATKAVRVSPGCVEPENVTECRCICKAGYVLGEQCHEMDGGSGGGARAANGGK